MAADYDSPRKSEDEVDEDSIEELKARQPDPAAVVDVDETELAEPLELPGADQSDEELTVVVLPRRADEFTCSQCFRIHQRSQLFGQPGGQPVCTDCAA